MSPYSIVCLVACLVLNITALTAGADSNLTHYNYLRKRAMPTISPEFDEMQTLQIKGALDDVLTMVRRVYIELTTSSHSNFHYFFMLENKDTIAKVFENILGGRPSSKPPGLSPKIAEYVIRKDFERPGRGWGCDHQINGIPVPAWSLPYDSPPTIVLCDHTLEVYGGIYMGYPPRAHPVTCTTITENLGKKHIVLGAILFREFLRRDDITRPPLCNHVHVIAQTPTECQKLLADHQNDHGATVLSNDDSWFWFLLAQYWEIHCPGYHVRGLSNSGIDAWAHIDPPSKRQRVSGPGDGRSRPPRYVGQWYEGGPIHLPPPAQTSPQAQKKENPGRSPLGRPPFNAGDPPPHAKRNARRSR